VTTTSPPSGPETLNLGLGESRRLSRGATIALVAALLALVAGGLAWRFKPAPEPLFSLSDLQGVYAGYEGNTASVIDLDRLYQEPGYVVPTACEPLFEATVLNRPPHAALDGVSTFWELNRSAVSLFTFRFADVASADREFRWLTNVFDNCHDAHIELHARPAIMGQLTAVPNDVAAGGFGQVGYVLTTDDGTKIAISVLSYRNTVTWQYRYDPVPGTYEPLTAQRVMESLADQMRDVINLHR
jgi:hypothetical protein